MLFTIWQYNCSMEMVLWFLEDSNLRGLRILSDGRRKFGGQYSFTEFLEFEELMASDTKGGITINRF